MEYVLRFFSCSFKQACLLMLAYSLADACLVVHLPASVIANKSQIM